MSTKFNQSGGNVKLKTEEMEIISKRYHIPKYHRSCFLRLANEGRITGKAFSERLHTHRNYKRAVKTIMVWLSRQTWHLFVFLRPAMFDKVERLFDGKNH